jgi:hypothetical protein
VLRKGSDFAILAATLAAALSPRAARAQGNDRSAPTGGRSALMGNTGVALGRDGAAPFLNPATIVGIADNSVAFSVNFFEFDYQHFDHWHQPAGVDTSHFGNVALDGSGETTTRFTPLPSTLCLFFTVASVGEEDADKGRGWRKGKQKLAICLGSLESQQVSLPALSYRGTTAAGSTAQVQSLNRNWNRLSVGPTYSVALTDGVSIGASLHGVLTSDSFSLNGASVSSVPGGGSLQSTLGAGGNGHALDITAILGATFRVGAATLGVSAQVPALHIFGVYQGTLENQYTSAAANTSTITSGSGEFNAPPPVRLAAGVGVEVSKAFTFEADGSYDLPQDEAITTSVSTASTTSTTAALTSSSTSATYVVGSRGSWNAAAGAEYFMSPTFSLIGGVSTNLTGLRPLTPSMSIGNLAQARTNWLNVSFGIGSYGGAGDLLLGAQLGYGWGEAIAINPYVVPNEWAVIDTQNYSALIVLAGSTNLRTLGRAMKAVEHVVTEGKPADAPK